MSDFYAPRHAFSWGYLTIKDDGLIVEKILDPKQMTWTKVNITDAVIRAIYGGFRDMGCQPWAARERTRAVVIAGTDQPPMVVTSIIDLILRPKVTFTFRPHGHGQETFTTQASSAEEAWENLAAHCEKAKWYLGVDPTGEGD